MNNQQKKKKTRKQSQREEKEHKLIAREHRTKKRHEQSGASIPTHPAEEKSIPQRLKEVCEIDDYEEENVHFVIQKKKVMA